jgi:hypothetical protein
LCLGLCLLQGFHAQSNWIGINGEGGPALIAQSAVINYSPTVANE